MTEQAKDSYELGIKLLREFGVPTVMLLLVMFCFREAAQSLHRAVLVPVVESHTMFIKSTGENLTSLAKSQDRQAEALQEIAEGKDRQAEILREIADGQRELRHEIITIRTGTKPAVERPDGRQ